MAFTNNYRSVPVAFGAIFNTYIIEAEKSWKFV